MDYIYPNIHSTIHVKEWNIMIISKLQVLIELGMLEAKHVQVVQQLKVQIIFPKSNKIMYISQLMNKPSWSSIYNKHLHVHFVLEQQLPTCWYMIHLTPMEIFISDHFQKQK
jgi:hypothetical protein